MFDVLLGLSAIIRAFIEIITIKEVNDDQYRDKPDNLKTDYEKSKEYYSKTSAGYDPEKLFSENIKKSETVWDYKRRKYREQTNNRQSETQSTKESPLIKWVMEHEDVVLLCLTPGIHLIKNEDLQGIDEKEISDFLFKQEGTESIERIDEGLEVTVR